MDYQAITYKVRDDVAVITLNRPDVMNALNAQMRAEITHAVKAAQTDARVLVFTGAGKAFCSGQDLGDGGNAANLDLERTLRDEYVPMLRAIRDSVIPTISAVNGAASRSRSEPSPVRGCGVRVLRGLFRPGFHADRPDPRCGRHVPFTPSGRHGPCDGGNAFR